MKAGTQVDKLADLTGKPVVSTTGTTNFQVHAPLNEEKKLGIELLGAKDHAESALMVADRPRGRLRDGRHPALQPRASAKNPADYVISTEPMSVEPYGIVLRRDDPAFQRAVGKALVDLFQSGEIVRVYDKWFTKPIPPKGLTLALPMSAQLSRVIAQPTSSGDPAAYR